MHSSLNLQFHLPSAPYRTIVHNFDGELLINFESQPFGVLKLKSFPDEKNYGISKGTNSLMKLM